MILLCGHDEETCPDACDGGGRVTWHPDPLRRKYGYGPGYIFHPDGTGGGVLEYKSKTTRRWLKIQKRPHLGG